MEQVVKKYLPESKKPGVRTPKLLDKNDPEFLRISSFYNGTLINEKFNVRKIFKIINESSFEERKTNDERIHCFHGSHPRNIQSILEDNLTESKNGCCGKDGVYLSAVSSLASTYGKFTTKNGSDCTCVFVVSFRQKDVVVIHEKISRNCTNKDRKRLNKVEKFKGNIPLNVQPLEIFDEASFIKKVKGKKIKETDCWSFTKYLAASTAITLEFLIFAEK